MSEKEKSCELCVNSPHLSTTYVKYCPQGVRAEYCYNFERIKK